MTAFSQYTVKDVVQPVDSISWTPPAIGMQNIISWHDASDVSTLEAISGKVSRRLDKSGNGRHLEQNDVADNRPTVETNYDSYLYTDSMYIPWAGEAYTTGDQYFILLAQVGYYGTNTPIVSCGSSPNGFAWDIRGAYGTTLRTGSSSKYLWHTSSSYNSMFQHIYGSIKKCRAQSSYQSQDWTALTVTVNPVLANFTVGGYGTSGMYMRFYEMLAFNISPSVTQIEYITAYLAHKWDALLGISTYRGFLDASNPFKSMPPKIISPSAYPRMFDGVPGSI